MSDLIDRQAAIKAIEDLPNCYNGFSDTYDKACIIGVIEELPSAVDCERCIFKPFKNLPPAQPEIIRCKDCKHQVKEWRTDKRLKDNGYMVYGCDVVGDACGYWALLGQDDDYCSFAERRADE